MPGVPFGHARGPDMSGGSAMSAALEREIGERDGESQKNRRTSHVGSPFARLSSREEAASGAIAPEHHARTTSGSADRGSAALVRRPEGQGGKRRRSAGFRPVAPQRS